LLPPVALVQAAVDLAHASAAGEPLNREAMREEVNSSIGSASLAATGHITARSRSYSNAVGGVESSTSQRKPETKEAPLQGASLLAGLVILTRPCYGQLPPGVKPPAEGEG
jgi:hypothetical protein